MPVQDDLAGLRAQADAILAQDHKAGRLFHDILSHLEQYLHPIQVDTPQPVPVQVEPIQEGKK